MLLELPEELVLIIVKKLDLHSKITLYNVCHYLRNLLTFHCNNKAFDLSKSTLATAATLKRKFFKDVSAQIEDLSLRTVPNITKSVLLPTIWRLTSLKYLNVSFTSVVIPDVIEILKVVPTLTGISVNFEFGNVNPCQLPPDMMDECQNLFKKLTDVEFVGSITNLLYSPVPYYVLKKTCLDSLKYSVIKCQHATYYMSDVVTELNVKYMAIFLTNWKEVNIYYGSFTAIPFLVYMHSNKYEFVLIKWIRFCECKVYTSAAFKGMFYQKFKVCEQNLDNIALEELRGNVAIFLWNKELNTFDSKFFYKFFERVKCFFPQCIEKTDTFEFSSSQPDWFYLTTNAVNDRNLPEKCTEPAFKKKTAPRSFTLDYDNCFSQMKKIELTINLEMVFLPAAITPNLNYLKKITYLSLAGCFVLYTVDFFEVLFKTCDKLCTLNVEACGASTYSRSLMDYIILSKSLRNLRIVDTRLNLMALFHSISYSGLLENVHIVDEGTQVVDIGDCSCIIANCPKLYSLFFQLPISKSSKLKALRLLNKAKSLHNRSFLNIELHTGGDYKGLSYDPLMEVFKISPIKPI